MKKLIGLVVILAVFGFASRSLERFGSPTQPDQAMAIPAAKPGVSPSAPRPVKENVVAYATQDEAMQAAKAQGRKTLPRFEKMWSDHAPGTYTVKIPLTQNGATEHIWMQVDGFWDNMIIGRLANEPVNGTKYRIGQDMTVPKNDVEDWMVRKGNNIWGGYSARVALDDMPKEQADALRVMFQD